MGKRYLVLLLALSVVSNIVLVDMLLRERAQRAVDTSVHEKSAVPFPERGEYPFIRVVDGDTITVGWEGDIEYVRLIGIDAPEPNDPGGPECYATESTEHLRSLLETGTVLLVFDESQGLRDKYNRILAYVERPDGVDVGLTMAADGYAREYTYDEAYVRQEAYRQAEQNAALMQRGLWGVATCK